MSLKRISAIFLRHIYLYRRNLVRILEVFYWPLLDILIWGFVSIYLSNYSSESKALNFTALFLGALILWDILFRSQQGITVSFLEEVWSRNFINLFVSPLTVSEYLISLMAVSIFKVLIALLGASLMAYLLYSFNLFVIGISLIPFVLNLVIMGWSIGIFTTALILRFGQQAEVLAWGIAFLFQPVSAVFYPVSVLPAWLRFFAYLLPASYVFEGMRSVIHAKSIDIESLLLATALNMFYLILSLIFFFRIFDVVREKGLLSKTGE